MSPRYLLIVGEARPGDDQLLRRLTASTGLDPAFRNGRMAALVNPSCPCLALDEEGCILGTIFPRHGPARQATSLRPGEAAAIVATEGKVFPATIWGGYVAAVGAPGHARILRDPSGTLSCYFAELDGRLLLASDADILVRSGVRADLDLEEAGRQLYRASVPASSTVLRHVRELLPGFSLDVAGNPGSLQACWSPWDHARDRSTGPEDAAERLRRIVRHCVHAVASPHRRVLLSVSGGLDSSILAACLAKAGIDTICLTMFAEDAAGDERPFARALCDHLGLPLVERPYRLEDIDITEALAPHLPRPRDRTQANAYERVHLEVAAAAGADAFMTGNGGDNVLGYSQSAAPVADRYLTSGLGHEMVRSLLDVCRQTGCSLFDALGQAWRLATRPPAAVVRPDALFLAPEFLAALGPAELRHPWLDAPRGALPGKAAHIAAVLRAQPTVEASRGAFWPVLSPMLSQPVLEACLEVPSWAWRAGGRDRALARRAFHADLPASVLERRVKGTPGGFAARLLDHFRPAIRDRLLSGRLAAAGIVDRIALDRALAGSAPVADLDRIRILELVNAEAWIEHWAGRDQAPEAAQAQLKAASHGRLPAAAGPIP